jgi:hypothetical protein
MDFLKETRVRNSIETGYVMFEYPDGMVSKLYNTKGNIRGLTKNGRRPIKAYLIGQVNFEGKWFKETINTVLNQIKIRNYVIAKSMKHLDEMFSPYSHLNLHN